MTCPSFGRWGSYDERHRNAARPRPEPLAGQQHPRLARDRDARTLYQRALREGPHIQPHDLRPRHQEQLALRRDHSEQSQGRQVGRRPVLRAGPRGSDAFMRGIERRVAAGLPPEVGSVASVFISRWDVAVKSRVPEALRNQLGIAIAKRTYKAYRELLDSPRWQRVFNAGARPQRLLWASTGTKDPAASDILYIRALAAPFTVNTMPEGTLKALADHGALGAMLPADGGDGEEVLATFASAGVNVDALASQLQDEGARSFVDSWREVMDVIAAKSSDLAKAS